nr:hypothetical protein HK105_004953 [Polyrhizophydium stewartii]
MNAKKLIEHTRNMLVQHELARMGIHAQDVKDELFKIADKAKRDLTQPIVVPEEDILAQYLAENKITAHNDRTFLTETFLGCVRHRKILERSDVQTTLRLFYEKTGGRYLQNEYYLFAGESGPPSNGAKLVLTRIMTRLEPRVFCYLALWRLEELGFARFSKFVRCFDPVKMSRLIGFIFNPVNLETDLKQAWGKVLDHQFLKEHVIDPILRHISVAQKLLEEHCDRADYGMVPKKSDKKSTEIEPFLLTQPKPRKLPEPTEKMSMIVKANPVPKTLYEDSAEMRRLERIRDDNRAKVMKLYETAQKEQFKVAQRRPSDKVQQIREQIEQERKAKFERERVKSHKAVPQFVHQHVPVKLTTAAILREDALVRKQRREEEAVLAQAEVMVRDPAEFETWKEECRAKDDEERLLELERRRLEILMVHEDAYIARQDKIKENREKAAEVLAVKDEIKTISELQRRELEEENKKKIEEVHEIKDGIVKAKAKMLDDKSKMATEVILESQRLLEIAQREAEEERARKTELIQQIRLLEKSIPPVGTFQKDVDLTETSGIGLLGEMSVVELQERLVLAKLRHKDAEERRRAEITEHKAKRIEQITQKLQEIDMEREERKNRRLQRILPDRGLSVASVRSDRSQAESLKEAILERDPKLRSLQAKIEERKAGTAMTEKWDDLDEAERMYVMQRRELRREQQTLLEEMARENISRTGAVPIVELKALRA